MDAGRGPTPAAGQPESVSMKQARIAELARRHAGEGLTNLHTFLDEAWLHEAFERTRRDGAPGIDGETWGSYAEDLRANLRSLLIRCKSGTCRAPPVRRVHIPKGDSGETRPIGIPTLEDRVLQRAVVMLLEPIVEREFLPCSYGFRPKRSAHQALDRIWRGTMAGMGWIVDVDLRKFFDTLDHQHLRTSVQRRVRDGVVLRLIGKWLHAGVMEEGVRHEVDQGTPQGGVISPLLANLYLHDALDVWVEQIVPPYLKGRMFLVRYADDFVIGCERHEDAEMLYRLLPKRLGKYGLTVHPEKTRLVRFLRPVTRTGEDREGGTPMPFDFPGFTHDWEPSRKGMWVVKRKTASKRLTRALKRIDGWIRKNMHRPIRETHATLCQKLRGHYAYYGITGNIRCLQNFRWETGRRWRTWLKRRSGRGGFTWADFNQLLKWLPLPPVRIVHPVRAANP